MTTINGDQYAQDIEYYYMKFLRVGSKKLINGYTPTGIREGYL